MKAINGDGTNQAEYGPASLILRLIAYVFRHSLYVNTHKSSGTSCLNFGLSLLLNSILGVNEGDSSCETAWFSRLVLAARICDTCKY